MVTQLLSNYPTRPGTLALLTDLHYEGVTLHGDFHWPPIPIPQLRRGACVTLPAVLNHH